MGSTQGRSVADELRGHAAILAALTDLGLPATRRALHRWTVNLPPRRKPPIRHEREGNRLVLVVSRVRLVRWVVRMDEERYAGFSKIRAHSRSVASPRREPPLPADPIEPVGRSSSRRDGSPRRTVSG